MNRYDGLKLMAEKRAEQLAADEKRSREFLRTFFTEFCRYLQCEANHIDLVMLSEDGNILNESMTLSQQTLPLVLGEDDFFYLGIRLCFELQPRWCTKSYRLAVKPDGDEEFYVRLGKEFKCAASKLNQLEEIFAFFENSLLQELQIPENKTSSRIGFV